MKAPPFLSTNEETHMQTPDNTETTETTATAPVAPAPRKASAKKPAAKKKAPAKKPAKKAVKKAAKKAPAKKPAKKAVKKVAKKAGKKSKASTKPIRHPRADSKLAKARSLIASEIKRAGGIGKVSPKAVQTKMVTKGIVLNGNMAQRYYYKVVNGN